MNIIDNKILKATRAAARKSPRRRANYCLHKKSSEYLQRMLQVVYRGTYFAPHKHAKKLELFVIVKGEMAVVTFDDGGKIRDLVILGEQVYMAEIAPKTWHSVVVLSQSAAFVEIIEGPYNPATHKIFTAWAPAEEQPGASAYLGMLEKQIRKQVRQ
jgi:cupin fold WbuC family metalloprotein